MIQPTALSMRMPARLAHTSSHEPSRAARSPTLCFSPTHPSLFSSFVSAVASLTHLSLLLSFALVRVFIRLCTALGKRMCTVHRTVPAGL